MIVCLYRVGRNLNRSYRTCEAFGVSRIELVECDAKLSGNLFAAKGRVELVRLEALPRDGLYLETWPSAKPIQRIDWSGIERIVIGGETAGLPKGGTFQARIPMFGRVSGLTVEAALAIALHEASR